MAPEAKFLSNLIFDLSKNCISLTKYVKIQHQVSGKKIPIFDWKIKSEIQVKTRKKTESKKTQEKTENLENFTK